MNLFNPDYLLAANAPFDALGWGLFIVHIAVLLAGLYFAFLRQGGNVLKQQRLRQLGYLATGLGGIGALFGGLWLGGVAPFTMPIWSVVTMVVVVAAGAYVAYYARVVYPRELSNIHTSRGKARTANERLKSTRPVANRSAMSDNHSNGVDEDDQLVRGGRRESRQRRKRKSK